MKLCKFYVLLIREQAVLVSSTFWRKSYQVRNPAVGSQQNRKLETELFPAADSSAVATRRLIVRDCVTGIKFLMDTGVDVSTIPVSRRDRTHVSKQVLYAANGTIVSTYGQKLLQLDLGFVFFNDLS